MINAAFAVIVGSSVQRGKNPRSAKAADRGYQDSFRAEFKVPRSKFTVSSFSQHGLTRPLL